MGKIAQGGGGETRGKVECCIRLEITPECYFLILHERGGALTGLKYIIII